MRLHYLAHERKAQTRATRAPGGKRLEQGAAQIGWHAAAVISHPQKQLAAGRSRGAQLNGAAAGRMRKRVQYQVVQHARHLHRVEPRQGPCAGL